MTFRDFFDIQYKKGIACLEPEFESAPDDIKLYNATIIKNYKINIDDIIGTYHPGYMNQPLLWFIKIWPQVLNITILITSNI